LESGPTVARPLWPLLHCYYLVLRAPRDRHDLGAHLHVVTTMALNYMLSRPCSNYMLRYWKPHFSARFLSGCPHSLEPSFPRDGISFLCTRAHKRKHASGQNLFTLPAIHCNSALLGFSLSLHHLPLLYMQFVKTSESRSILRAPRTLPRSSKLRSSVLSSQGTWLG
jgi:hypothetical protein